MSFSTVALNSANTWVGISSFSFMLFSRHRIAQGTGTFTQKVFIVRLSLTAHLQVHDTSNFLCSV